MNHATFVLLAGALGETLLMVAVSGLAGVVLGVPLGMALHVSQRGRLCACPGLHRALDVVVNVGRSVPFIILLVALVPFTRLVTGTSIGVAAAIVPLSVGAIPFVARLAESALQEVPPSLVEAAQSLGAGPWRVMWKVLLPEAAPGLANGITISLVTLINYSAMAGAVGGGGLGDVGIRYGYQRFDTGVMLAVVALLVILVQLIQLAGSRVARALDRRY